MAHGDGMRHGSGGGSGASSLNIEDRQDNLLPMPQRLNQMHARQNRADGDMAGESHALPDAGSHLPLSDPSWIAHANLIKDKHHNLGFDTGRLFDGIVAAKAGIRGLYDPNSSDYARWNGLRTNLAVLRNTLRSSGMDDQHMKTIAEALGDGFANDRWWKRPFTRWLSRDVASVEAVGAGEMYKHLLEVQDKPALLQSIRNFINSWLDIPDRNWRLLPLTETPFSPPNLAAPLRDNHAAYADMPSPATEPNFAERYRESHNTPTHFSRT